MPPWLNDLKNNTDCMHATRIFYGFAFMLFTYGAVT